MIDIPKKEELTQIIYNFSSFIEESNNRYQKGPELDKYVGDFVDQIVELFEYNIDVDNLQISTCTRQLILDNRFSVLLDAIRRLDFKHKSEELQQGIDEAKENAEDAYNTAVAVGTGEWEY